MLNGTKGKKLHLDKGEHLDRTASSSNSVQPNGTRNGVIALSEIIARTQGSMQRCPEWSD
jgi:hypothetical protein